MKKVWVVYVEQGVGHELHNDLSEADFYGPYTEAEAKRLERELNALFEMDEDDEHQVASVMQLYPMSVRDVLKHYKIEPAE